MSSRSSRKISGQRFSSADPTFPHRLVLTDEYEGIPWRDAANGMLSGGGALGKLLLNSIDWEAEAKANKGIIEMIIDARRCSTFNDHMLDEIIKAVPPSRDPFIKVMSATDVRKSPYLRELRLWDAAMPTPTPPKAQRITDKGLDNLDAPNMRIFMLAGHYWLSPPKVIECVKSMKHLTTLSVRGMVQLSSKNVVSIVKWCAALTSLDLFGVYRLGDDALRKIGSTLGAQLVSLDLGGCARLSAHALRQAAPKMVKMQHLGLASLPAVSDDLVHDFVLGAASMMREETEEEGGAGGTRESRHSRGGGSSGSFGFNLTSPRLLGAASASAGALSFGHGITELDLSFCSNLTDLGLAYIEMHCYSTLRELNVRRCELVTDLGVVVLTHGCESLTALDLSWCDCVTTPTRWGRDEIEDCRNCVLALESKWR